jgi:hypothetical protein
MAGGKSALQSADIAPPPRRTLNRPTALLGWTGAPSSRRKWAPIFKAGKLNSKETVVKGIDQAPAAFIGLFHGQNVGKMVVELA